MSKTVIISGGMLDEGFAEKVLEANPEAYIIAVDKGLEYLYNHKIEPQYIVGDFDSIDPKVIDYYRKETNIPIREYNPVKDATDTEIALRLGITLGSKEMILLGATGGRIDHLWANVQTLSVACDAGVNACILDEKNIAYDYCPGVSAFCGAASALNLEYTLPDISQSVIITRMEGRTPVPSKESIQSFAAHQATMVVFLSTGMLEELSKRLIEGGYTADTPAAIVYKATWPEQKTFVCTVGTLAKTAAENNITKTALMIIGDTVAAAHYDRSKLYDPEFTTEFREAVKAKTHHS
jgi:thiamine pyrophosphokinase